MLDDPLSPAQRLGCIVAGVVAVLLLWQAVLSFGLASPLLLPAPTKVAHAFATLVSGRDFWRDLGSTVGSWLAGLTIGVIGGGAFGLIFGTNRYLWAMIEPTVEFLRALPSVVLVPLVSLFAGVGGASRVTCAALVVAVLMLSSTGTAVRSIRASYLRIASAFRMNRLQVIGQIVLPASASQALVALRAAIPLALIVTVAADMLIATDSGIGRIIMDSLAVFDVPKLYAAITVVGVLGYLAALIGTSAERSAFHWSAQ